MARALRWLAPVLICLLLCVSQPGWTMSPQDQKPSNGVTGPDAALGQRLDQSAAVISGVVTEISRSGSGPRGFLSQHDPDWWQATIQVESVEKGNDPGKTMTVLYANSADVAWFRSPKLKKGDHGVFLLQNKDPFGKAVPSLAVVDPLDFRPIAELPRVRALLKSAKPK